MVKFSGTLLGHYVLAELSELTGSYFVEIDSVPRATGEQIQSDRPVLMNLDGHELLIRFSGKMAGHIEVELDGNLLYKA